ncbi:MAG: hypothetical protein RLY30_380 [Pseudomonadota bacterium]
MIPAQQEAMLRRKIARERKAREEAEELLEFRSKELYEGSLWLQEAASRLSLSESHLRAVLNAAQEAIITFDEHGLIYEANQTAEELFHFQPKDMLGLRIQSLIPELKESLKGLIDRSSETEEGSIAAFEAMGLNSAAEKLPISLSLRKIPPLPGEGTRFVGLITDRRRELALERQLNQITSQTSLSLFDQGEALILPRRAHLEERFLSEQRAAADGASQIHAAVLCINIDRFKRVNSLLSYDAGDRLITKLGSTLQSLASELAKLKGWEATTVRLEGDEFATLLLSPSPLSDLENYVRRLRAMFGQPVEYHAQRFVFSLSVGGAVGLLTDDFSNLLDFADRAMRVVKQRGGNGFKADALTSESHTPGRTVEHNIILGLERNQFTPYFQPKVELNSGLICGFESLLRWPHPERGLIPLGEFLPTLEVSSLMLDVGLQVFEQVLQMALALEQHGFKGPVSFNVSNGELLSQTYRSELVRLTAEAGVPPGAVMLEITETVMANLGLTGDEIFASLRDQGFLLSIDDFGVGSSSLARLRSMPVQELKIDRSFVTGISHSRHDRELLSGIVQLGRSLGLSLVLEGVETKDQIDILSGLGEIKIQGFYYSKALPQEAALRMALDQPWRSVDA